MSDLTPERRAELRVRAEFAKPVIGFGFVDLPSVTIYAADLLTLLDADDERDRLAEVDSRLSVLLWRLTSGRLSKTSCPVEYMEQEIEECLAQYHESGMRDERDRLSAAVERVRVLHRADGEGFCLVCDYMTPHPCPTLRTMDDDEDYYSAALGEHESNREPEAANGSDDD